jgi:gamma-glutamyltranspeptidase
MAEAEKLAYADRAAWLGDPDFVKIPLAGLTSKAYAEHLRALISPDRARPATDIRPGEPQRYESDQTTHFSIVDSDGDAVANTYTLNLPYGSGLVADGTGVLLNNELDDFAAKPGAANVYGLLGGDANAPGPMKRPLSSMSPTLVFKDGKLDDGDRKPRRIAHHHGRAAGHRQRDRPWAQRGRRRKMRRAPTTSCYPDELRRRARHIPGHHRACSRRWATRSS